MSKASKYQGPLFAIALVVILVVAVGYTVISVYTDPVPTEPSVELTVPTVSEEEEIKDTRIVLFETSDIQGNLIDTRSGDKSTFEYRLAYMAKIFNDARASEDFDGVLLVDGGDLYQGTPLSSFTEGAALRAALDQMGYDAVTVGNDEFDWDFNTYASDVSATVPAYELGEFANDPAIPVIAANLYNSDNQRRTLSTKDYVIVEKAGLRIALIGYIPDYSSQISSSKFSAFEIHADLAEFSQRVKEINISEQPAITIVVTHADPEAVADALDPADVDLVTGSHTEEVVCGFASNGIAYIQTDKDAQGFSSAILVVDKDGNVTIEDLSYTSIVDEPEKLYDTSANGENLDPVIMEISHAALDSINDQMNESLGYIETSIDSRNVISGTNTAGGNFVTSMMLEYMKKEGVVAAFYNGGGVGKDFEVPQDGMLQISVGDIYTLCPFNNSLLVYEVSGLELAQQLANGFVNGDFGDQVSGLTFEYKNIGTEENPVIEIVSITLSDGTKVDIADNDTKYKICITDYSAELEGSVFAGKTPLKPATEAPVDNLAIISVLRDRRDKGDIQIPVDRNARATCLSDGVG